MLRIIQGDDLALLAASRTKTLRNDTHLRRFYLRPQEAEAFVCLETVSFLALNNIAIEASPDRFLVSPDN
jgi:hypothetical protein